MAHGAKESPYVMLNLTSLTITETDNTRSTFSDAFSLLTAPALDSLELRLNTRKYVSNPVASIEAFLARSRCTLGILVLDGVSIVDEEVIALLKQLPSLIQLTIMDSLNSQATLPVTKKLVESLHGHRHSALHPTFIPIIPKLQSITLGVHSPGFDAELFVNMIASRWFPDSDEYSALNAGVSCMRSVELFLSKSCNDADYIGLNQFEKVGMCTVVKKRLAYKMRNYNTC
ncbi:hypothetical protein BDP27DRAFT_1421874 [Rhodocollybia butyracea]|uniref:Uncharacterized protein n=1 Tax=Rhodocollybia butyracea TaxID=206335 RepID=A0A9P5U766_9AGAR|nr:hypothetical protein BDP27DRAFT_1421874 [Rhodocollybia butyracea]